MSLQFQKKLLIFAAALFAFAPSPLFAEWLEPDAAQEEVMFETSPMVPLLEKGDVGGIAVQDPEGVYKFYKSREFAPLWTDKDEPSKLTKSVLPVLENSWEHGFNPANYHLDALKERVKDGKVEDIAAFEVLMSDAVARFGKDMSGMRVSARAIGEDSKSWLKGLSAEEVLNYIAQAKKPEDQLAQLAPPGKLYPELQKELKSILEDMKKNPEANVKPIAVSTQIYPHKSHSSIPAIRERFGTAQAEGQPLEFYDDSLIAKITDFQKANGLKPDGVIGKRTISAINQGRKDRLVKVLANLERLRWANTAFPDKYIMVNIPAMTLWAFENNKLSFEMPVIVGTEKWPTNSFKTDITGIRFNPSWHVPPSIKTKDLLPELRQDPGALEKKNLQLLYYTSDGAKPVSAHDVNWDAVTEADLRNFGMVQNPGNENPLGKIRVLMPNQYDIYLHDTNSPDLFTKDFRALSHGCIRLSEPRRVANFILDRNPDWTEERLNGILGKRNTIEVAASHTIPVYIVYQTIWETADGQLIYGQDIYRSDEKLVAELQKKQKLPVSIN